MNKFFSDQVIELLDRKYQFVVDSPPETFLLDLSNFVDFLLHDEMIRDYTVRLKHELRDKFLDYLDQIGKEKLLASQIKEDLLREHPELDSQNVDTPEPFYEQGGFVPYTPDDHYTFAIFGNWLNSPKPTILQLSQFDTNADKSGIDWLLKVLWYKVNSIDKGNRGAADAQTPDEQIITKLKRLEALHEFTQRDWRAYCQTSAGNALRKIEEAVRHINPHPKYKADWESLNEEDHHIAIEMLLQEKWSYNWVRDAAFESNHQNLEAEYLLIKTHLRRVYETIRQNIGTTSLHIQALNRYKTRCHWYNREHLQKQLLSGDKFIRNREDVLTRDLALYLYDQGITTTYRLPIGNRELDLVDLDSKNPMVIEVKAYKGKEDKLRLRNGVYQLCSYLSFLDTHLHLNEGYYIYFRIAGPIIRFENDPIRIVGFIIHPILVDLAESEESGSKSEEPLTITHQEIELGILRFKKLNTILTELRRNLAGLYGGKLVDVVLFGSQARGDAVEGSDIDVLIVLKGEVRQFEEVARTSEFNAALCLKYDVLISRIFVSEDDYRQSQMSLLENARIEGIRI